jgi:hypothetical protein
VPVPVPSPVTAPPATTTPGDNHDDTTPATDHNQPTADHDDPGTAACATTPNDNRARTPAGDHHPAATPDDRASDPAATHDHQTTTRRGRARGSGTPDEPSGNRRKTPLEPDSADPDPGIRSRRRKISPPPLTDNPRVWVSDTASLGFKHPELGFRVYRR